MSTVIYARQSLDRTGKEAAVSRQLAESRELAAKNAVTVDREIVDNDLSATNGTVRPGFVELVAGIRAGTIDTVVCWHTDRLYRRLRDLVDIIEAADKKPLRVLAVTAGDLDLNTPAGRMVASLLGSVAAYEGEQKAARQVAANIQRAEAGVWQFSIRPYGYERVNGAVQIVEHEAAVLREAYDRYLNGWTYYAIVEDLNARGVPTMNGGAWTMTQLRARLRNPAYAGIRAYKGEPTATGNWEPIIDMATWERFTASTTSRRTRHDWSNKTKYLLSGLAVCGVCGARMLARPYYGRPRADGTKARTRQSYQCTTSWCTSRDQEKVDALVEAEVIRRLSQPDALALLTPKVDVAPLAAESQELRGRMDDLASLLADGTLTAAAVRVQQAKLRDRLDELQSAIAAADGGSQVSALLMAESVAEHWRTKLTLRQKRSIIMAGLTVTIFTQDNPRRFDPERVRIEWIVSHRQVVCRKPQIRGTLSLRDLTHLG